MSIGVSGYVLAGGESSRMQHVDLPQDKALIELAGQTLLQRALRKVNDVCGNSTVLCGTRERGERLGVGFRSLADHVPGCGPLGGMHAALRDTAEEWLLMVPVDLPLLPASALRRLVEAGAANGPRVTCFESDGLQPLPVVIHRSALPVVEGALQRGERKLMPVLRRASETMRRPGLGILSAEDLASKAEVARWFLNVNTPADYFHVQELARQGNGLAAGASE